MATTTIAQSLNTPTKLYRALGSIVHVCWFALEVSRQRRALRSASQEALRDMGLTQGQALRESQRAFWDLPKRSHYRLWV